MRRKSLLRVVPLLALVVTPACGWSGSTGSDHETFVTAGDKICASGSAAIWHDLRQLMPRSRRSTGPSTVATFRVFERVIETMTVTQERLERVPTPPVDAPLRDRMNRLTLGVMTLASAGVQRVLESGVAADIDRIDARLSHKHPLRETQPLFHRLGQLDRAITRLQAAPEKLTARLKTATAIARKLDLTACVRLYQLKPNRRVGEQVQPRSGSATYGAP